MAENDEVTCPTALWGTYKVPSLAGVHGRIAFQGPALSYMMQIDDERVTLTANGGPVDCVISCKEPGLLTQLVRGEANLVTMLLQGRIGVRGNPMLALRVAGSIPELGRRIDASQGEAAKGGG